jgi:hypothetical protein
MLTRGGVTHAYDSSGHPATHPRPGPPVVPYGPGGGMTGGAVTLQPAGSVGVRRGHTGYGYLGLDPSDPSTWVVRSFNPAPGMITYLNGITR